MELRNVKEEMGVEEFLQEFLHVPGGPGVLEPVLTACALSAWCSPPLGAVSQ